METEQLLGAAFKRIAAVLAAGGRVVIGTNGPVDEGFTVGTDGERHIVIKCRSTRQDFLDTSPVGTPEQRAQLESMHPPFYYELEMFDRVLKGPDGFSLGIRIRQAPR